MNLAELQKTLLTVARANPPSDRVPYAFEKRIMALLTTRLTLDTWAFWSRALWRGAASCVAVMLLLSAWSFLSFPGSTEKGDPSQNFENAVLVSANNSGKSDLSQNFENAVLAAVDQEADYSW